jgi:hypothetical protein
MAVIYLAASDPLPRLVRMAVGFAVPVVVAGVVDVAFGYYPLQTTVMNVYANTWLGVSGDYGVNSWHGYVGFFIDFWSGALPAIILFAIIGARQAPMAASSDRRYTHA